MMHEDSQRSLLMAQLNNKRALKQKYLYRSQAQTASPLTELVMTNIMLRAVWKKADIFAAIRRLRAEAEGIPDFGTFMGWIDFLAQTLDCSPYELFIRDSVRQEKIVRKLLEDLGSCDSWENIHTDDLGNCTFALNGFDYAYRMTETPSATLLFEKTVASETAYILTLGDGRNTPIPGSGVLWQEAQGPLQAFMDRVLEELNSGWPVLQEQFRQNRVHMNKEKETLEDLSLLLEEAPSGLNTGALLAKEAEVLSAILEKERILYDKMPQTIRESGRGKQIKNALLLLGGAIQGLKKMAVTGPDKEALAEALFLLEHAAEPI